MQVNLKDKVALVTGAGAGIGHAIAKAYSDLGTKLVVAEIDAAKCAALRKEFPGALIEQVDVRDVAQVNALRDKVEASLGSLDILVNNVGDHLGLSRVIEDTTEEQWEALYDVNLKHMFIVTRAFVPGMKKANRGGSIINLSSIEGFRGFPSNPIYTTFKHAVTGFTRAVAMQLAPFQIRVNVIGPETTESEQVPLDKMIRPEIREASNRTIPMNRYGRPEDHAGVAVFLASDLAAWVTGQPFIVDGGSHCAGGFHRTPEGDWTIMPLVTGKAI